MLLSVPHQMNFLNIIYIQVSEYFYLKYFFTEQLLTAG